MTGMKTYACFTYPEIWFLPVLGFFYAIARRMKMQEKEKYMQRVLELAAQGMGKTSPNPMVGCVVVKNGKVISEGFHEQYGGFHAERNALLKCGTEAEGADLYVNLEPCCHQGKTPPCTDIIIEKKIKRVFVGCLDSNPLVAGKGIKILEGHGIEVETGILEKECRALNEVFFHYIETGMPFVAMKYAMTLDGKIACETGDSKWVTGECARNKVQQLRNQYRGIMAGIGTVLADNPMLNCRIPQGRNPIRIICDSQVRIPENSQIVTTAPEQETILAYCQGDSEKIARLKQQGLHMLPVSKNKQGQLNLKELMQKLAEQKIDSILLEGGGTLNASMLSEQLVQRVYAFIAPKLVAGATAKSPIEGNGIEKMQDAIKLQNVETIIYGEDIYITGRVGEKTCSLEL